MNNDKYSKRGLKIYNKYNDANDAQIITNATSREVS